jgi:hypothetical protein
MITDAFFTLSNTIFSAVLELLPNADMTIVTYIGSQMNGLKTALNSINWFFPMDTLFMVLGFVIAIELISLTLKIIFWVTENISIGLFKAP